MMAGADSLCPNLVNSSSNGGFHAKGFQMIWQDMVLLCLDGFGLKKMSGQSSIWTSLNWELCQLLYLLLLFSSLITLIFTLHSFSFSHTLSFDPFICIQNIKWTYKLSGFSLNWPLGQGPSENKSWQKAKASQELEVSLRSGLYLLVIFKQDTHSIFVLFCAFLLFLRNFYLKHVVLWP